MDSFNIDNLSVLSVGTPVRELLLDDEEISGMVTKVFPLTVPEASLPYIVYRRESLSQAKVKSPEGPVTAVMEIDCYAGDYDGSVALAESVRRCLNGCYVEGCVRSCWLVDARENYTADAYVQQLFFEITV